jgi:hypothetical protein
LNTSREGGLRVTARFERCISANLESKQALASSTVGNRTNKLSWIVGGGTVVFLLLLLVVLVVVCCCCSFMANKAYLELHFLRSQIMGSPVWPSLTGSFTMQKHLVLRSTRLSGKSQRQYQTLQARVCSNANASMTKRMESSTGAVGRIVAGCASAVVVAASF